MYETNSSCLNLLTTKNTDTKICIASEGLHSPLTMKAIRYETASGQVFSTRFES
jgi:hypothetical protein